MSIEVSICLVFMIEVPGPRITFYILRNSKDCLCVNISVNKLFRVVFTKNVNVLVIIDYVHIFSYFA